MTCSQQKLAAGSCGSAYCFLTTVVLYRKTSLTDSLSVVQDHLSGRQILTGLSCAGFTTAAHESGGMPSSERWQRLCARLEGVRSDSAGKVCFGIKDGSARMHPRESALLASGVEPRRNYPQPPRDRC